MELLEGRTLADLLDDDGPPAPELAFGIARQILRGLAFAHARGIVHRDLKAANIFLQNLPDHPHHVKILDFGLAKIFTTEDGDADPTLTKSGTILGTPAYMSPEQASGSAVDERADVYSAGVLLFEMLTGRYPFEAPTRADMLRAHMLEPVPTAESAREGLSVAPELSMLIEKAMAKDRNDRFQDATSMLEALEALPTPSAVIDGERLSPRVSQVSDSQVGTVDALTRRDLDGRTERDEPTEDVDLPPATSERLPEARRGGWFLPVIVGLGVVFLVLTIAIVLTPAPDASEERTSREPAPADPPEDEEPAEDETPLDPTVQPSVPVDEGGEPEGQPIVEPVAVVERVPAVDPFGRSLPPQLRRYHVRVRRGQGLSRRDRRALFELQRAMAGDPRPSLILAHHFVDIGFLSDGLMRYERAHELDPSSRGDPRMLRDLVRMSTVDAVAERATALVLAIYGDEALEAVDTAIEATEDPSTLGALTRLRQRMVSPAEPEPEPAEAPPEGVEG
jgi:serine/threonine-protein kinase